MKFFLMFPPRTEILAPPLYTVYIYIYSIFINYQLSLVPPNFYSWRTPCSAYSKLMFSANKLIQIIALWAHYSNENKLFKLNIMKAWNNYLLQFTNPFIYSISLQGRSYHRGLSGRSTAEFDCSLRIKYAYPNVCMYNLHSVIK